MLGAGGVKSCGNCDGGAGWDGGEDVGDAGGEDGEGVVASGCDVGDDVSGSGTPDDGVGGVAGLGGGDFGVNGHGREGGSKATSETSGIFGGREDDLLGGESLKGSRRTGASC